MKTIYLVIIIFLFIPLKSRAMGDSIPDAKYGYQIVTNKYHTCALDEHEVKCWGRGNWYHELDAPPLSNPLIHPKQVSSGDSEACAIDDEGVKCWGSNYVNIGSIPPLSHPKQVSVGSDHACAIDDTGVVCWGGNDQYGQLKVPPGLINPRQVSAGLSRTCALDDVGVICWGHGYSGYDDPPLGYIKGLSNPRQISSSSYDCAIDDRGAVCWDSPYDWAFRIEGRPIQISSGRKGQFCLLDDNGVHCFIDGNQHNKIKVPPLSIYVVMDIRHLAPGLPESRARFAGALAEMETSLQDADATSRSHESYFLHILISPCMESVDAPLFKEKLIPRWKNSMHQTQIQLGYADVDDGLLKTPDTEFTRTAALTSIQSALTVALEFLSPPKQAGVQEALRATGQAMMDVSDQTQINLLLAKLEMLGDEKQTLKVSTKSTFLVDSLEIAAMWLALHKTPPPNSNRIL